ncbi:related to NNK1 - protein kinase [Ustilago trichophora]|uniref:Related to NNK1 - protein kinase n=1 Tax=Ustilago trichophora TaxID=86804 RepID=A0A5C3ENH2_9BASI|nr:related to NNK1 - protein kinase [Ustilago trichophora]
MEPPKAAPLQIPSEDDVPLFDPSGLSASLSADDWHNSFDLNSVAAARLGIGSPPSHDGSASLSAAASIANLTRSDSRNNTNSDTVATSDPQRQASTSRSTSNDVADGKQTLQTPEDDARRGRRRRSSAAQNDVQPPSAGVNSDALPQKDTSVGSKVRMWWERSAAGTPEVDENDSSIVEKPPSSTALPSLRTDVDPTASSSAAGTTFTSPTSITQDTSSPTVRSPAADFLSAFSSLHSVVQPSTSYDNRSLSYSPPRSGHRSLGASLMREDTSNGSAAAPGFASWRGLGSAAAQLYDAKLITAPNPPPRSDDEGARVGPSGRYLLGKTIGFGGFSTVREGWDLEAQGPADPTAPMIDGQRRGRKVAVKIVYHDQNHDRQARDQSTAQQHQQQHSQELHIWKSLPFHQHLLPLLHHERVSLDGPHADQNHSGGTMAELLIMPYCDQGNLLDFVRSEGGIHSIVFPNPNGEHPLSAEDRRSGSGSWVAPSPARSSTQLSRSSSLKTSMDDPTWRYSGPRTGSGFMMARNAGSHALGRVASVSAASQLRTIPAGQEASSVASSPVSAAGSVSSGSRLIRRTNSRLTRSQGVPIDAARETMRQLASALSALHNKSHILHGDLKLENVLGQDQTSWKKRQRMSMLETDGSEARSRQNSGGLADSIDSLGASSISSRQTLDVTDAVMPCWRIADFGLAQVLEPTHAKAGISGAPALIRALKEEMDATGTHEGNGQKKAQRTSRGGSLAYTAPEFLRAQGTPGSSSPRVAQPPGEDGELPPESPYAADMWALGCILYALLSGKLPFSDSFEPRLQMKIAKAQWELPSRLRRRAERLTTSSTSTLTSQQSVSNRNSSMDRAGSVEPPGAADRFAFSQRRSASGVARGPGSFGVMDLSASLPSLLPRERQATEPAPTALPGRMIAVHSDQVVGSAPGRADHLESFEINEVAKARADVEEDPESDEDSDIDPAWDGLSWDRAAARQVLRGLLEPDPRRRWTIDKLCSCAWIRQEGTEPAPSPSPLAPMSLLGNASAARSNLPTSISTATSLSDAKGVFLEREAWAAPNASTNGASKSSSSVSDASQQPNFDKANVDEHFQRTDHGRRSSSLARTRPVQLALDSPASASPAQSPAISMDEDDSAKRRSRSTSRISLRYRDSSRNRSTDVSGSSTPNRDRDPSWMPHHLASSLNSQTHQWVHAAAKDRCDSPADSERRGRLPRSRMADLDENTTWNGEGDTSSDSRAGSQTTSSLHRTVPIAIRGRSHSRSRSRHSGESGSPERFAQRSISRSRSNYSLSHENGGGASSLLYGRSVEVQPVMAPIMADHTQAQRSSTARSRSRAPDALAQILGRQRSRSRSRVRTSLDPSRTDGTSNRSTPSLSAANTHSKVFGAAAEISTDSDRDQEARGRARDRR